MTHDDQGSPERPDPAEADSPRFYAAPPLEPTRPSGPGCTVTGAALLVGLLFTLGVAAIVPLSLPHPLLLLIMQVALVAGVAAFLHIAGHSPGRAFRIRPVAKGTIPLALLLGVALLLANLGATLVLGPSDRDIQLVGGTLDLTQRLILGLTVAFVAPLAEEVLFRGLIQGVLEEHVTAWVAIVLAAIPFALLHGWPAMLFFVVWSLPLGWITWRTKSILPALVVHVINNMIGLVGLLAAGAEAETLERSAGGIVAAVLVLAVSAGWTVSLCKRIGDRQAAGNR